MTELSSTRQNKRSEISFFSGYAIQEQYDVLTPDCNAEIIERFVESTRVGGSACIADLGCGSGVFTELLRRQGLNSFGIDLTVMLLHIGRIHHPALALVSGDVESLPIASESVDAVLLSGLLHHLPDPTLCVKEVWRVLKPGGRFMAFDPNRCNPAMYLYRDRSSPLYSSMAVTENERPVLAPRLNRLFNQHGFDVYSDYLSAKYRFVASERVRWLLPIYNKFEDLAFRPKFARFFRSLVLTHGRKLP